MPYQDGNLFSVYEELEGGGNTPNLSFKFFVFAGCFNFSSGYPLGFIPSANSAGMFHHVSDLGGGIPFITMNVGTRSGFSTDYTTNTNTFTGQNPSAQIVTLTGATQGAGSFIPINAADTFRYFTQEAQSAAVGHADVDCYGLQGTYTKPPSGGVSVFGIFNVTNNEISFLGTTGISNNLGPWAKRGNTVWFNSTVAMPNMGLYTYNYSNGIGRPAGAWNVPTGGPFGPLTIAADRRYRAVQATTNYLWLLDPSISGGNTKVYQTDYAGNLVNTFICNVAGGSPSIISGAVTEDESIYYVWWNVTATQWRLGKLDIATGNFGLYFSYNAGGSNPNCNGFGLAGIAHNALHIFNNEILYFCFGGDTTGGAGYIGAMALRR